MAAPRATLSAGTALAAAGRGGLGCGLLAGGGRLFGRLVASAARPEGRATPETRRLGVVSSLAAETAVSRQALLTQIAPSASVRRGLVVAALRAPISACNNDNDDWNPSPSVNVTTTTAAAAAAAGVALTSSTGSDGLVSAAARAVRRYASRTNKKTKRKRLIQRRKKARGPPPNYPPPGPAGFDKNPYAQKRFPRIVSDTEEEAVKEIYPAVEEAAKYLRTREGSLENSIWAMQLIGRIFSLSEEQVCDVLCGAKGKEVFDHCTLQDDFSRGVVDHIVATGQRAGQINDLDESGLAEVRYKTIQEARWSAEFTYQVQEYLYPQKREPHPSDRKVVLSCLVDDLQLTAVEEEELAVIAGPRFNRYKRTLRLVSTKFPTPDENIHHVAWMLNEMYREIKQDPSAVLVDPDPDEMLDDMHHMPWDGDDYLNQLYAETEGRQDIVDGGDDSLPVTVRVESQRSPYFDFDEYFEREFNYADDSDRSLRDAINAVRKAGPEGAEQAMAAAAAAAGGESASGAAVDAAFADMPTDGASKGNGGAGSSNSGGGASA